MGEGCPFDPIVYPKMLRGGSGILLPQARAFITVVEHSEINQDWGVLAKSARTLLKWRRRCDVAASLTEV